MTDTHPETGTMTDTHREIGRRRIAGGDARSLLIRRTYDAPIDDVWSACTEPERLNRWFTQVSGDLRAGGTFSIADNASGEILRCEPPRLLAVTWCYGDRAPSEVELRLSEGAGGATILELEHASIDELVEVGGRMVDPFLNDAATGMWGMGAGWEMPLTQGLARYLRGELPDVPASEWFELTPEALALTDECGRAWAAVVAAERGV